MVGAGLAARERVRRLRRALFGWRAVRAVRAPLPAAAAAGAAGYVCRRASAGCRRAELAPSSSWEPPEHHRRRRIFLPFDAHGAVADASGSGANTERAAAGLGRVLARRVAAPAGGALELVVQVRGRVGPEEEELLQIVRRKVVHLRVA
mgnify:CR=1 FL=1